MSNAKCQNGRMIDTVRTICALALAFTATVAAAAAQASADARAQYVDRFVTVNGLRLHYLDWGVATKPSIGDRSRVLSNSA